MIRATRQSGFSLIEVILIILIIGASFSGLSVVLSNTTVGNMDLDIATQAVFLARGKMAETKAKSFANVASVGSTNYGGDFSRYNYQVDVDYVEDTDLDTPVVGPTEYKRIIVTVTASGWSGSIQLYELRTNT